MCRLLAIRAPEPFAIADYLARFAEMCRHSKEFQGHGWGLAYRRDGRWRHSKNLKPIWEDDLAGFGNADLLLVHARSAFRNEDIALENNMPFSDGRSWFLFNGELRRVRYKAVGRTGAAKIFNTIRRFDHGDTAASFSRGVRVIMQRSGYVRALNLVMTRGRELYIASHYNEDPGYFAMHRKRGRTAMVCSQPLGPDWEPIPNNSMLVV